MVTKVQEIDDVMELLAQKYEVKTANPKKIPDLYLEETAAVQLQTPYITDNAYFYFLSQYGDVILSGNGVSIGIFGFGYWEGMAITDYDMLNDADVYVFADNADEQGTMTYFAFHSKIRDEKAVWVSNALEQDYLPVHKDFLGFLQSILEGAYDC